MTMRVACTLSRKAFDAHSRSFSTSRSSLVTSTVSLRALTNGAAKAAPSKPIIQRSSYVRVGQTGGVAIPNKRKSVGQATNQSGIIPKATSSVVDDGSFPLPQPASELPDYANLAPPVESVILPTPSTTSHPEPHLWERPQEISLNDGLHGVDWNTSFFGLSAKPFEKSVAQVLLRPLTVLDVEIKPDGLLYLPEIKYRRTLNEAFGPGGWGMAPRGETTIGPKIVSREWGLVCLGRLVAIARGEQEYFDPSGIPTATEACKSNALMRCCKDLGIASELWDPSFIRQFKSKHCTEAFVEHVVQKKKRKLWRKNDAKFEYPYKEA